MQIAEMKERVERNKEAIIEMLVTKTLDVKPPSQHCPTPKTEESDSQ